MPFLNLSIAQLMLLHLPFCSDLRLSFENFYVYSLLLKMKIENQNDKKIFLNEAS